MWYGINTFLFSFFIFYRMRRWNSSRNLPKRGKKQRQRIPIATEIVACCYRNNQNIPSRMNNIRNEHRVQERENGLLSFVLLKKLVLEQICVCVCLRKMFPSNLRCCLSVNSTTQASYCIWWCIKDVSSSTCSCTVEELLFELPFYLTRPYVSQELGGFYWINTCLTSCKIFWISCS